MGVFVVDASIALAWCFADEATNWTEAILERLRQGDHIIVPAHWPTEVANALLMGVRRNVSNRDNLNSSGRNSQDCPSRPSQLNTVQAKEVLALGEKHGLTVYDAAYLELARRRQLAMGTLD